MWVLHSIWVLRHKMCKELSFENLFSGIYGLSTKTHPDICGSHLVTIHIYWYWAALGSFGQEKGPCQLTSSHWCDSGWCSNSCCSVSHGQRTTGLAIRVHCYVLYWKFMKSLFVVILPFFAVTIPGMLHFKCQPPQPKVQTCLKHHLECIGRIWNWFVFPKGNII